MSFAGTTGGVLRGKRVRVYISPSPIDLKTLKLRLYISVELQRKSRFIYLKLALSGVVFKITIIGRLDENDEKVPRCNHHGYYCSDTTPSAVENSRSRHRPGGIYCVFCNSSRENSTSRRAHRCAWCVCVCVCVGGVGLYIIIIIQISKKEQRTVTNNLKLEF